MGLSNPPSITFILSTRWNFQKSVGVVATFQILLLSTQIINVARFARNAEWDFFCDVPNTVNYFCSAAVSFMVADMFDKSIDIKELTRAARYGRTVGSCHTMKCDIVDNQLRTVGDYLGTFEEFITQIFNSISESLNFGK